MGITFQVSGMRQLEPNHVKTPAADGASQAVSYQTEDIEFGRVEDELYNTNTNSLGLYCCPQESLCRTPRHLSASQSPPFHKLDSDQIVPPHLRCDIFFEKESSFSIEHQEYSFSHYQDYNFPVRAPPPSEASPPNSPRTFPVSLPPSPELRPKSSDVSPTTTKAFSSLWSFSPSAQHYSCDLNPHSSPPLTPETLATMTVLFEPLSATPRLTMRERKPENAEGKRSWEACEVTSTPQESPILRKKMRLC